MNVWNIDRYHGWPYLHPYISGTLRGAVIGWAAIPEPRVDPVGVHLWDRGGPFGDLHIVVAGSHDDRIYNGEIAEAGSVCRLWTRGAPPARWAAPGDLISLTFSRGVVAECHVRPYPELAIAGDSEAHGRAVALAEIFQPAGRSHRMALLHEHPGCRLSVAYIYDRADRIVAVLSDTSERITDVEGCELRFGDVVRIPLNGSDKAEWHHKRAQLKTGDIVDIGCKPNENGGKPRLTFPFHTRRTQFAHQREAARRARRIAGRLAAEKRTV